MTLGIMIQLCITVGGWVALFATMRAQMANLIERVTKMEAKLGSLEGLTDKVTNLIERVTKLETRQEHLPQEYVPRPEMQARLDSIDGKIGDVKGLLQVAVYNGRGIKGD